MNYELTIPTGWQRIPTGEYTQPGDKIWSWPNKSWKAIECHSAFDRMQLAHPQFAIRRVEIAEEAEPADLQEARTKLPSDYEILTDLNERLRDDDLIWSMFNRVWYEKSQYTSDALVTVDDCRLAARKVPATQPLPASYGNW